MKKRLLTAILTGSLIAMPIERAQPQLTPAICLILFAAAAVGGVVVLITCCRPKYWCVSDDETGDNQCRQARRMADLRPTLRYISGPYKDATYCDAICATNTVPPVPDVHLITVHIESSTDLVHWKEVDTITVDPDFFEWHYTNTTDKVCYYRTRSDDVNLNLAPGK